MANVIYNGTSSETFGLFIENNVEHELSSNDIETEAIEGRDGVLLKDRQRLKPVEKAFPMILKNHVHDTSTSISDWLGVKGWHDLEFSWDSEYLYQATVINQISISEVVRQFGKLRVVFLVHPVKFFKDSLEPRALSNGETFVNRGNVEAKPVITLEGNGDTTLTINGRRTLLEDVQGTITLDMQKNLVYSGNLSAWDKVLRASDVHKPFLDPGENAIEWTGNFTARMIPNEGVRI